MIGLDGSGLEQITVDEGFDGFPMFSPDGTKLIWASQRADPKSRDVNLYIADFKP
jgi:Tol biopolymer transport system component